MTTYTAADFDRAEFARHPHGRTATKRDNDFWVTSHGLHQNDQEMAGNGWSPVRECPDPDEHGPIDYKVLLEQAEQERDEAQARSHLTAQEQSAPRTARELLEAVWEAAHVPEDGVIHAGEACVERHPDGEIGSVCTYRSKVSATGGAGERRLIDPRPTRPEGAEAEEDWLIEHLPHEYLTDDQIATVADLYASRGVRVEGSGR